MSDAGAGVEDLLRVNFGRVEAVILDFYHVAEHLGDLGRALYPADESAREEWWGRWRHRLKHDGGEAVLNDLRALPPDGRESVRRVHGEVVGYFENHVHRMDYPAYRAKGWAIGSGPIESACKTVIGKRMKNGGMRGAKTEPTACATFAPVRQRRRSVGRLLASQPKLNRRYTHRSATYPRHHAPGSGGMALTDQDRGETQNDRSAVSRHVPHPGSGLAADQNGEAAEHDHVGRTDADGHVPHPRRGQTADQNGDGPWRQDRPADVRDEPSDHRTDVHVGDASGGLAHDDSLPAIAR